ncbi:hypothetical protein OIO90_002788 [Microbotryomycetes sp. JL221]|nr:hypothetical protein OIO90_002788 [Microbotryomycetes sp. JL221]
MAGVGVQPPPPAPGQGAREPHLVALKVLRAAKPSLVQANTKIYYEDSSMVSRALQQIDDNSLDERHDSLGHITGALMLPSTFGTIYLGETFSALLSLSNDLARPPEPTATATALTMKVEMNTGTPAQQPAGPQAPAQAQQPQLGGLKHHLATVQAPNDALRPGESVEALVSHEIKELGMHALVCTVTYAAQIVDESSQLRMVNRSFRKVYKFQVSNPLSVRTKAHSPNINVANAVLRAGERDKIFLEVQVQNQCETAMIFERMRFDSVPGMTVRDVNESIFEQTSSLLSPGAVRQLVFVLTSGPDVHTPPPGSSQELGRLELVWRTPHGELGRLQTSMLGRRVPERPPQLALPALPIAPPRQVAGDLQAAMLTPAPFQSPRRVAPAEQPVNVVDSANGFAFDLAVVSVEPPKIVVESVFTIRYRVRVRSTGAPRSVQLAVQHINWHYVSGGVTSNDPSLPNTTPSAHNMSIDGPKPSRGVDVVGSSTIMLPDVQDERSFEIKYFAPAEAGPYRVGGTRILLLGDQTARTVLDINVAAEIWVTATESL